MNYTDERKAAKQAEVVVNSLVVTTPRTDAKVFVLRYAAVVANDATKGLPSEALLNAIRHEVTTTLNRLCCAMDQHVITREIIDRAQDTVATWLRELERS